MFETEKYAINFYGYLLCTVWQKSKTDESNSRADRTKTPHKGNGPFCTVNLKCGKKTEEMKQSG